MTPTQITQRLATLPHTVAGEALLEVINKRIETATNEMMTNTNTNAMFSARGAVLALTRLRETIVKAPELAETLRQAPPT